MIKERFFKDYIIEALSITKGEPVRHKVIQFYRRLDWFVAKYIFRKSVIRRRMKYFDMFLDLLTPGISKTLAIYRIREADMVHVISEYLKEGMTVIDCGSNIGFYPLLEANIVRDSGIVIAIEPDPRNYRMLMKNICLSSYKGVIKPYQIAVSNKSGSEEMFITSQSNLNKLCSGDNRLFSERHSIDEVISVRTVTLDEFCSSEGIIVDFIRMDIEGSEVEVFQGMEDTLVRARKGFMVLLELHPHLYSEQRSLAKELEKLFVLGYKVRVLISAGEAIPSKYRELGYAPKKEIITDGFVRGYYEDVKNEDAIELACGLPKVSRYILIEKQ